MCLIKETQEALDEETRLRESALVFTAVGSPALVPADVAAAVRMEFPDVPSNGLQVSLMQPGSFFVRFAHRRWFDLVRGDDMVRAHGTPLLIRRWNRLTFATSVKCRYSVRLFIQGIPPHEFSLNTAQDLLPNASSTRWPSNPSTSSTCPTSSPGPGWATPTRCRQRPCSPSGPHPLLRPAGACLSPARLWA